MMKNYVCIDAVFEGMAVPEAWAAVKAAGFDAVEFWSWWDKDLDELRRVRDKEGLEVAARIVPYLVALLVAVGMFRAAGALADLLIPLLEPTLSPLGVPTDVLPRAINKFGGFDPEALRKSALETDIPVGGTIQGYGVKFFPPGHRMAGQNSRSTPVVMQYIDGQTKIAWPKAIRTVDPVVPLPISSPYAAK